MKQLVPLLRDAAESVHYVSSWMVICSEAEVKKEKKKKTHAAFLSAPQHSRLKCR